MSVTRKVFIYNGAGAGPKSASDLREFFIENPDIFVHQPDIQLTSFDFIPEGLECPLFVIPGGSSASIGRSVKPFFDEKVSLALGQNYNYIGVCAGAIVGSREADIFLTPLDHDKQALETNMPGEFFGHYSTKKNSYCIGVADVDAIGAFYPHPMVRESRKDLVPYTVRLACKNDLTSTQLYVSSPGFIPATISRNVDVVATYKDRDSYPFYYKTGRIEYPTLHAIVRQKPTEVRGGRVLSGTHFETCVKNSKLLSFFGDAGRQNDALPAEECVELLSERKKTTDFVKELCRTSLK